MRLTCFFYARNNQAGGRGIVFIPLILFSLLVTLGLLYFGGYTSARITIPAGMVYVPAGEFLTGGYQYPEDGELNRSAVWGFFIDKCEVTNAQFEQFIKETDFKGAGNWKLYNRPERRNYPVVGITWEAARSFAQWAGKRLPTGLEWEKAARGTEGSLYPWGNLWDPAKARVLEDEAREVGEPLSGASPYGVLNMADNVMEWTQDAVLRDDFNYFQGDDRGLEEEEADQDEFDEAKEAYNRKYSLNTKFQGRSTFCRVIKGGCWALTKKEAGCSFFHLVEPFRNSHVLGFRCVKDLTPRPITGPAWR